MIAATIIDIIVATIIEEKMFGIMIMSPWNDVFSRYYSTAINTRVSVNPSDW